MVPIKRDIYNRLMRMLADYEHQTRLGPAPRQAQRPEIIRIKNASGSSLDRLSILGIDSIVWATNDAVDQLSQFKADVVFTGITPTSSHAGGLCAVLLEPAVNNQVVTAAVGGVCQVKIAVSDASHTHADVTPGDSTKLTSAESGTIQILWKETGTGDKWAVVRFGGGGGGTGTQITQMEIAETPVPYVENQTEHPTTYSVRPHGTAAWANGTTYAVDGAVKNEIGESGTELEHSYKCILAHKSGADQWVSLTHYLPGARVWYGTGPNDNTYKCVTENTDENWTAGNWTLDNDEPGVGNAWEDYWSNTATEAVIEVEIGSTETLDLYYLMPFLKVGDVVKVAMIDGTPHILKTFFYVGDQKSLYDDQYTRRKSGVFRNIP